MPTWTDAEPVDLSRSVVTMGNAQAPMLQSDVFQFNPVEDQKETDNIEFGQMAENVKVLHYNRDMEPAKPIELLSGATKSVKAPTIRVKKNINKMVAKVMNPAFASYNRKATSPSENLAELIALEQLDMRRKIDATKELQCAQALYLGASIITFGDGTSATIDMGYTSGSTPDATIQDPLAGGSDWATTTVDPITTLERLEEQIRRYSDYDGILRVDFGSAAWTNFRSNEKIQKQLDISNLNVGSISVAGRARYKGQIGQFQLYTNQAGYFDSGGTYHETLDPNDIVMYPVGSPNMRMIYGAVFEYPTRDSQTPQWLMTQYFSKIVQHQDPPTSDLIVETHPLALVKNPLEIRRIRVVA